MRARQVKAIVVVPLVAGMLAGCGDSEKKTPEPVPGKTVSGETETGMKVKVETFFDPAKDPKLKEIDAWRAAHKYPAVDFHRVTADNTNGQLPDSGKTLRFAPTPPRSPVVKASRRASRATRSQFEWVPPAAKDNDSWNKVRDDVCADGPPKQDGIAPGARQVYYLFTTRDFDARGHQADARVRPARRRVQVAKRGTAAIGRSPRSEASAHGVVVDSVNAIVLV